MGSKSKFYRDGEFKLNTSTNQATSFLGVKALPTHLKYAYHGEQETLPVIVASNLTNRQEEELLATLRRHKEAIG